MTFLNNNIIRPSYDSLTNLLNIYNGKKDSLLEVGSYCGYSTFYFAKFFKKVYAVDKWQNGYDNNDPSSNNVEDAYTYFLKNMLLVNNVYPIKLSSVLASMLFEEKSINVIYLDGCHQKQEVLNDLIYWYSKVADNGMICGHDYYQNGVMEAVDHFFDGKQKIISDIEWYYILEK